MTDSFYKRYSIRLHQKFVDLGASFKFNSAQPAAVFLESNYQLLAKQSILGKAINMARLKCHYSRLKRHFLSLKHL
jgi:hypothetical protein